MRRGARAGLLAALALGASSTYAVAADAPNPPPIVVTPGEGRGAPGVGIGVYSPGGGMPGGPSGGGGVTPVLNPVGTGGSGPVGGNGNPFIPGNTSPGSYPGCPPALNDPAWVAYCNPPATPAAAGAAAAPPPPPSIALASAAYGELTMPAPVPSHYPTGTLRENGHPYTLVNANTWFWTDPATWKSVSKTVSAGAVWGKATATPVSLSFSPGDGAAAVSCPGPGAPFVATTDTWVSPVNPQGCSYRYVQSSLGFGGDDQVTATYTISWRVDWTGSDGSRGTFNDLQTQTASRFAVAELQTVVTR